MIYIFLAYLYFTLSHVLTILIFFGIAVLAVSTVVLFNAEGAGEEKAPIRWVKRGIVIIVAATFLRTLFPGPSTIVKIVAVGSAIAIYQGNAEAFNSIPPKLLKLAESYIDKAQAATDPNQKGK